MRPFAVRTTSTNPAAAATIANTNAAIANSGGRSACSELLISQPIAKALATNAEQAAIPFTTW